MAREDGREVRWAPWSTIVPRYQRRMPEVNAATVARCPPLIISEGEIDELLRKFGKALDETADALSH
jgi:hypothetical protein